MCIKTTSPAPFCQACRRILGKDQQAFEYCGKANIAGKACKENDMTSRPEGARSVPPNHCPRCKREKLSTTPSRGSETEVGNSFSSPFGHRDSDSVRNSYVAPRSMFSSDTPVEHHTMNSWTQSLSQRSGSYTGARSCSSSWHPTTTVIATAKAQKGRRGNRHRRRGRSAARDRSLSRGSSLGGSRSEVGYRGLTGGRHPESSVHSLVNTSLGHSANNQCPCGVYKWQCAEHPSHADKGKRKVDEWMSDIDPRSKANDSKRKDHHSTDHKPQHPRSKEPASDHHPFSAWGTHRHCPISTYAIREKGAGFQLFEICGDSPLHDKPYRNVVDYSSTSHRRDGEVKVVFESKPATKPTREEKKQGVKQRRLTQSQEELEKIVGKGFLKTSRSKRREGSLEPEDSASRAPPWDDDW